MVVIISDSGYFCLVLPDVDIEFAKSCQNLCIVLLSFYYFTRFSQGKSIESELFSFRADA